MNKVQFEKFCNVLGLPELSDDPRFNTHDGRVENREVLSAIIEPVFRSRTTDEWLDRFEGTGMPYASVNNMVCKS